MAAIEVFQNVPSTTVTSGGATAPASGTSESWTVASSAGFATSATGVTQFHIADPAATSEMILVTNITGTTWTVTRGAESTTPVSHSSPGFTITQVTTAGFLASVLVNPMTTLGDMIYGGSAGTIPVRLAGNTATARQFMNQTGNGTISAAPAWGTLLSTDVLPPMAGGTITGALSLSTGNMTLGFGNFVSSLGGASLASDLDITVAGHGIKIATGANAKMGTQILTAGGLGTVANTSVTANSVIELTAQVPGGTPGALFVNSRSAGTSFVVKSTSSTDTSIFGFVIYEPG